MLSSLSRQVKTDHQEGKKALSLKPLIIGEGRAVEREGLSIDAYVIQTNTARWPALLESSRHPIHASLYQIPHHIYIVIYLQEI